MWAVANTRSNKRRWLVTGGSGQVGQALRETSLPASVELFMPDRNLLDLSDLSGLGTLIAKENISAIINCAAYTVVDKAETETELANKINAEAAGILAKAAASKNIPMVHVSTDYVFSGNLSGRAYLEDDTVDPQNIYGRSKLAGEQAVEKSGARAVILRTAWVVSPFGNNFVKTMLRLGREKENLSVVGDQIGNPTSAHDIASALVGIMDLLETEDNASTGIYHFVNSGQASWYDLAARVFERASYHGQPAPNLGKIATAEYPTPAKRPANSMLDTNKLRQRYDMNIRPWQDAIDEIVDRLCTEKGSGI
ncbi:dTDP-4-dehydrorhamnose reductase [hydrothermal vent metagenome]|uniref:dTDP-4-dehydrorhamnose reductase n=1 Tax=hydrothermal vent metagenome TaxID=652676 RepID=A0A3B0RRI4_9ZZZZ